MWATMDQGEHKKKSQGQEHQGPLGSFQSLAPTHLCLLQEFSQLSMAIQKQQLSSKPGTKLMTISTPGVKFNSWDTGGSFNTVQFCS